MWNSGTFWHAIPQKSKQSFLNSGIWQSYIVALNRRRFKKMWIQRKTQLYVVWTSKKLCKVLMEIRTISKNTYKTYAEGFLTPDSFHSTSLATWGSSWASTEAKFIKEFKILSFSRCFSTRIEKSSKNVQNSAKLCHFEVVFWNLFNFGWKTTADT